MGEILEVVEGRGCDGQCRYKGRNRMASDGARRGRGLSRSRKREEDNY